MHYKAPPVSDPPLCMFLIVVLYMSRVTESANIEDLALGLLILIESSVIGFLVSAA